MNNTSSTLECKSIDVLHVSEAYGGGVQSAISRYIENSPSFTHHVLVRVRAEHNIGEHSTATMEGYDGSLPSFLLHVRAYIQKTRPRVVHLHSSLAGLLRAFILPSETKIVYTPHAYAFLRRDYGRFMRMAYRATEVLLTQRKQTVAGISPFEVSSAVRLAGARANVVYIPNVVPHRNQPPKFTSTSDALPKVVMVGRISEQKDPDFLVQTALASNAQVQWIWVGDGDSDMRTKLTNAGVVVTGWLPNDQVYRHLASADLYLHTAQWEGAPITLLEAASLGTPVLVRGIDCLEGLGFAMTSNDATGAAIAVDRFFTDQKFQRAARAATEDSLEVHSPEVQSRALEILYGGNR
ncbi:glycosyltransferase family 4 protein [Rhodococcus sp. NPDC056743]|uniref:glycosyltransferase family 4 protein n=1 Tax=Rhodococcus sp. NPDC056743 TaxID=3345934 RepID=UPI00366A5CB3